MTTRHTPGAPGARWRIFHLGMAAWLALLAACGGGADDPAAPGTPTEAAQGSGHGSAGPDGVVVTAADGARVHVPRGATAEAFTVTLARDSEGAPALPAVGSPAGAVYKLTPHGARFALPVQVVLPVDSASAPPGSRLVVFRGDPGGTWELLAPTRVRDGRVTVFTDHFSYFLPMWITGQTWFPAPAVSSQAFVAWSLDGVATTTVATAPAVDAAGNLLVDFFGDPWPTTPLTVLTQASPTQPVRLTLRAALPANSTAAAECHGSGWEYAVRARHVRVGPTEADQGSVIDSPLLARLRPAQDGTIASVSFDVNLADFAYEQDPYGGDSTASWLGTQRVLRHPEWPSGLRLEVIGSCIGPNGTDASWMTPVNAGGVNLALRRGFPDSALAILQHPADLTVVEGQPVRFEARVGLDSSGRAAGEPTWQRSFAAMPDVWLDLTGTPGVSTGWVPGGLRLGFSDPGYYVTGRYPLDNDTPQPSLDDQGLFRLRLCPPAGVAGACVTSRPARLTVTRNFVAPQGVQAPPATVTVRDQVDNEVAQITASFSGLPQPVVSWQVRQPGSPDFVPVDPATHSIQGPTLTVRQRFTLADRGREYQAVASNGGGVAISPPTRLWVTTGVQAPTITTQPADITVAAGGPALLAAAADGGPPLGYQWFFNGQAIAGANGPLLALNNVNAANAGSYQLEVRNAEATVRSRSARLSVSGAAVPAVQPPSLSVPPVAQTVAEGSTATLAVVAGGTAPLAYQWRRNGVAVAGASGPVLSLMGVTPASAGDYSVQVSNAAGQVVSAAVALVVQSPSDPAPVAPTITVQPYGLAVVEGQAATLAVAASGSGPLRYQWYRDDQRLNGATEPVLVIATPTASQAGRYTVVVGNAAGEVTSAVATLVVTPPPGLPAITALTVDAVVTEGLPAQMQATVQGSPTPRCQWTRNGLAIDGATDCSGYALTAATLADQGAVFNLVAYNPAGAVFGGGVLLVLPPPPPMVNLSLLAGSPGATGSTDGALEAARFHTPNYLVTAPGGGLAIGDFGNSTIRRLLGSEVSTLAGSPGVFGFADGTGSAARFAGNGGLAYDSAGHLYVSDWDNHVIRRITPDGTVTTFAGTPGVPGSDDGTGADARFRNPNGLTIDAAGNLYVADWGNHTIRKITPAGEVSTFAGAPGQPGSADGAGGAARFNTPGAVAIDGAGRLVVSDMVNHTIRQITPDGQVSTIAGQAGEAGLVDARGAAARLNTPAWISAASDGTVFFVEAAGDTVRRISPDGDVSTVAGVRGENTAVVLGNTPRLRNVRGVLAVTSRQLVLAADHALLNLWLP